MKNNNDNNSFYLISKSFSQIQNLEDFEEISFILWKKFANSNILKINPLVIMSISNSFFGKIICLSKKGKISKSISMMIKFFFKNNFVSPIFINHFHKNQFNTKKINSDELKIKDTFNKFLNKYENNLSNLMDLIATKDNSIRNYGYSLVDLKGNFIWCDNRSQQLFELYKIIDKNFFDLLIPLSKNLLKKKFCKNNDLKIFGEDAKVGSSVIFSYIVYSHNKLNKFSKFLIKNGIKKENELDDILNKMKNSRTLYNMYLKSLSSRFSIISLKSSKDKLNKLENLKNKEIEFFDGEKNVFLKIGEESVSKNNGFSYINRSRFKIYYKNVILIETRISKKIHNFDFLKMKNDPQIKEFQKKIFKKLKIK